MLSVSRHPIGVNSKGHLDCMTLISDLCLKMRLSVICAREMIPTPNTKVLQLYGPERYWQTDGENCVMRPSNGWRMTSCSWQMAQSKPRSGLAAVMTRPSNGLSAEREWPTQRSTLISNHVRVMTSSKASAASTSSRSSQLINTDFPSRSHQHSLPHEQRDWAPYGFNVPLDAVAPRRPLHPINCLVMIENNQQN